MADKQATTQRDGFKSKWGFILACIGSAVGMGNIWRFPIMVSLWGGMTFLIPYFICVILIGSTGVIGEFALGRATGAGPIGIIAAGICKFAGARRVIITDLNDYRLDLARKMGVDAAVNTAREDLHEVMHQQGLTEGFDVGLEMSGSAQAFHQMISVMRNGGKISLLGLGSKPIEVDMNTIIWKGLTLQGIYGRKMDNWHQMSYMVQGGLDLTPVITHRFHYTDFEKGFAAMNSGRSGKVVLDWTK